MVQVYGAGGGLGATVQVHVYGLGIWCRRRSRLYSIGPCLWSRYMVQEEVQAIQYRSISMVQVYGAGGGLGSTVQAHVYGLGIWCRRRSRPYSIGPCLWSRYTVQEEVQALQYRSMSNGLGIWCRRRSRPYSIGPCLWSRYMVQEEVQALQYRSMSMVQVYGAGGGLGPTVQVHVYGLGIRCRRRSRPYSIGPCLWSRYMVQEEVQALQYRSMSMVQVYGAGGGLGSTVQVHVYGLGIWCRRRSRHYRIGPCLWSRYMVQEEVQALQYRSMSMVQVYGAGGGLGPTVQVHVYGLGIWGRRWSRPYTIGPYLWSRYMVQEEVQALQYRSMSMVQVYGAGWGLGPTVQVHVYGLGIWCRMGSRLYSIGPCLWSRYTVQEEVQTLQYRSMSMVQVYGAGGGLGPTVQVHVYGLGIWCRMGSRLYSIGPCLWSRYMMQEEVQALPYRSMSMVQVYGAGEGLGPTVQVHVYGLGIWCRMGSRPYSIGPCLWSRYMVQEEVQALQYRSMFMVQVYGAGGLGPTVQVHVYGLGIWCRRRSRPYSIGPWPWSRYTVQEGGQALQYRSMSMVQVYGAGGGPGPTVQVHVYGLGIRCRRRSRLYSIGPCLWSRYTVQEGGQALRYCSMSRYGLGCCPGRHQLTVASCRSAGLSIPHGLPTGEYQRRLNWRIAH